MRCCRRHFRQQHGLSRRSTRPPHCSIGGNRWAAGRPACWPMSLTPAMGVRAASVWAIPFHPPGKRAAAAHRTPERLADVHPDPAGGTGHVRSPARRWRPTASPPQCSCAGKSPAVTTASKAHPQLRAQRGENWPRAVGAKRSVSSASCSAAEPWLSRRRVIARKGQLAVLLRMKCPLIRSSMPDPSRFAPRPGTLVARRQVGCPFSC